MTMGIYKTEYHGRFKYKKDLKAAIGTVFYPQETSMFGAEYKGDGTYVVVGPNPQVRTWFAQVTVKDGVIEKVA